MMIFNEPRNNRYSCCLMVLTVHLKPPSLSRIFHVVFCLRTFKYGSPSLRNGLLLLPLLCPSTKPYLLVILQSLFYRTLPHSHPVPYSPCSCISVHGTFWTYLLRICLPLWTARSMKAESVCTYPTHELLRSP